MQIAYSFDKKSVEKIVKGACIAMSGAAVLALLNFLGGIHIDNPTLAATIAFLVPTLTNVVKEWQSGKSQGTVDPSPEAQV